jgi:hypothetical protein
MRLAIRGRLLAGLGGLLVMRGVGIIIRYYREL